MKAIEKTSQMTHPAVLAIGRMIQSATSAAASAIGVALIAVPWYSVVAQPSDANTRASATSAPSSQRVGSEDGAIREFRVNIPQAALDDLRTALARDALAR